VKNVGEQQGDNNVVDNAVAFNTGLKGNDRRRASRHHCNMNAKIRVGNKDGQPCIIKNLSVSGARLLISTNGYMPNEFFIEIPSFDKMIKARKVWTESELMGIRFVF
jgi:hypothetical protein